MILTFFGLAILLGFFITKAMVPALKTTPKLLNWSIIGLASLMVSFGQFHKIWFYAEPGYIYHVRTITGIEKVVDGVAEVGYNVHLYGRYNAWKRAMTVQAVGKGADELGGAENDSEIASAVIPAQRLTFLDQVDGLVEATGRFRLPTDHETFLSIVHEYRTPENLLRTNLIPTFKETLAANASLMGAEEYYSGGRTEFNNEFTAQLRDGIYVVKREEEVIVDDTADANGSANAAQGIDQSKYGDNKKIIFKVNKQYDENGKVIRKPQSFAEFGIEMVDSRITDLRPNQKFLERMQLKQKASADRAIAREQRIQEEEQRLLAIAKGEREVAERQAKAKVEQIEKTTNAETEKQLAITEAQKMKEQAEIQKETSAIQLEKARLEAQTTTTLADAEAYAKKKLLQADGALKQKLDALVRIAEVQADAMSKRKVPSQLFISGNATGGMGNDAELAALMQTQLLKNMKSLNIDMDVK